LPGLRFPGTAPRDHGGFRNPCGSRVRVMAGTGTGQHHVTRQPATDPSRPATPSTTPTRLPPPSAPPTSTRPTRTKFPAANCSDPSLPTHPTPCPKRLPPPPASSAPLHTNAGGAYSNAHPWPPTSGASSHTNTGGACNNAPRAHGEQLTTRGDIACSLHSGSSPRVAAPPGLSHNRFGRSPLCRPIGLAHGLDRAGLQCLSVSPSDSGPKSLGPFKRAPSILLRPLGDAVAVMA